MEVNIIAHRLEGIQTIESIKDMLEVDIKKAVYYVQRLRKCGYVKTKRLSNNRRVYNISPENRLNGTSYYDILNQYSPIKIATPDIHLIYGKEIGLEETLIFAIKTRSVRTILASLALFKKINNWTKLYHLAKEDKLERQVCALYEIARSIMKVRRIYRRFLSMSVPGKNAKFEQIIEGLKSKDYKQIEDKWKVYIPFNKKDLEEYTHDNH